MRLAQICVCLLVGNFMQVAECQEGKMMLPKGGQVKRTVSVQSPLLGTQSVVNSIPLKNFQSYLESDEVVTSSNNYFGIIKKHDKGVNVHITDLNGKTSYQKQFDKGFACLSLCEKPVCAVTMRTGQDDGAKTCRFIDWQVGVENDVAFYGEGITISPTGRFAAVTEPDVYTDIGNLKVFFVNSGNEVVLNFEENSTFMGCRFSSNDNLIVCWSVIRNNRYVIKVCLYDVETSAELKSIIATNSRGVPLSSAMHIMTDLQASPGNTLFSMFVTDPSLKKSATSGYPNSIIMFNENLECISWGLDGILTSAKIANEDLIAITYSVDEIQSHAIEPTAINKLTVFSFLKKKTLATTEGISRRLAAAVVAGNEIQCSYDVDLLRISINRLTGKTRRLSQIENEKVPLRAIGSKVVSYSYKTRTHSIQ